MRQPRRPQWQHCDLSSSSPSPSYFDVVVIGLAAAATQPAATAVAGSGVVIVVIMSLLLPSLGSIGCLQHVLDQLLFQPTRFTMVKFKSAAPSEKGSWPQTAGRPEEVKSNHSGETLMHCLRFASQLEAGDEENQSSVSWRYLGMHR